MSLVDAWEIDCISERLALEDIDHLSCSIDRHIVLGLLCRSSQVRRQNDVVQRSNSLEVGARFRRRRELQQPQFRS